jgi:hypothetical protein
MESYILLIAVCLHCDMRFLIQGWKLSQYSIYYLSGSLIYRRNRTSIIKGRLIDETTSSRGGGTRTHDRLVPNQER